MSLVLRLSALEAGQLSSGVVANGALNLGLAFKSAEHMSRELKSQLKVALISCEEELSLMLFRRAAARSIL